MGDLISPLGLGIFNVLSWPNILIPVLGTILAMIPSFLPGIGGASVAAVAIAATLTWDPVSVLLLFGALTGGATFMGSITAILFNIPGNASSAAVLLDGYPMARGGRARTAIACAATASALGSVFGVLVLIAILPFVQPLLLQFGPLEKFLLGVWGLSTIIAVPSNSPIRAVAVTLLGLILAMVGADPETSRPRWTFGNFELFDGFNTVAMFLGFFTLAEIISWRRSYEVKAIAPGPEAGDSTRQGVLAVFRHWGLTIRSAVIGTLVGVIPGVGGTVASFVAYGHAVQSAKDRSRFGKGDIRGVIAPEAAVDAKDGGSLLPVLALGLPGSEGGVILLTVLGIHGFVPGTPMLTTNLSFTYTLIFALLLSNILTSLLGVALAPSLARLTRLRIDRVALPMLVASLVTVVQLNGLLVDLYAAVGFGMLGYFFKQFGWPRVPFVIAFVLGGFIESNLNLSLQLFSYGRIAPQERPAVWVIAAIILLSVWWMSRRFSVRAKRPAPNLSEPAFAVPLLAAAGVFALVSLRGGAAYSGYAQIIVWSGVVVLGVIALAGSRSLLRSRETGAPTEPPIIAKAHRLPLLLLGLQPVAVWLLGPPIAIAAMVGVWLSAGTQGRPGRLLIAALVAAATGLAVAMYLDQIAMLRLPRPAFLALLAGIF